MQIKTFTRENYRGCPVYFRNFKHHFEYLVVIRGELYTAHITVNPHWLTNIFYLLKIEEMPYSQQHLKGILGQLRKLAHTTIDFVIDPQKK
jgi:hypothetical protein